MPYGARLDMIPFQEPRRSRLAIRLVARDGRATVLRRTLLPVIGAGDVILPAFDEKLGNLAIRAQEGDTDARDALFFAYLPKLDRIMSAVRPPFAAAGMTGTWDRDDIEQEGYLAFVDLLQDWTGELSFTAWLLARYPWRLKDAVRNGVGRPMLPRTQHQVGLELAVDLPSGETAESDPDEQQLIDVLLDVLPYDLAHLLVQRVLLGKPLTEIARDMQLSRRTLGRYWSELLRISTEVLRDRMPVAE